MFEAAELGRSVSKADFEARLPELRTGLLGTQRQLRNSDLSVIVIISGVEGAGRSQVVNRLTEWLDPRGIDTHAFWDESSDERQRPPHWRFWRRLPAAGRIALFYGSWYTKPIIGRALGEIDELTFDKELRAIEALERMLSENGTLVLKLWFHLPKAKQARRLKKKQVEWAERSRSEGHARAEQAKQFHKEFETFLEVTTRAIRLTDTGICPWQIIEASNRRYRDLTAGRILLEALQRRLAGQKTQSAPAFVRSDPISPLTVLDQVDLAQRLKREDYRVDLKRMQRRLSRRAWAARAANRSLVILFEGWDAAGKGGAIRRFTAALDARLFQVVPIGAPTDEERAHHYLWRFWRQLPSAGKVTIFDRSWYGRVLVERVEGFAQEPEWMRAYSEINDFEERLVDGGIGLVKFWIHISRDEQLRRLEGRQSVPWKAHKVTDEDWRNREKWDQYRLAVNDMVARTSTTTAPWTLVAGNDKLFARIQILKTISRAFDALLE